MFVNFWQGFPLHTDSSEGVNFCLVCKPFYFVVDKINIFSKLLNIWKTDTQWGSKSYFIIELANHKVFQSSRLEWCWIASRHCSWPQFRLSSVCGHKCDTRRQVVRDHPVPEPVWSSLSALYKSSLQFWRLSARGVGAPGSKDLVVWDLPPEYNVSHPISPSNSFVFICLFWPQKQKVQAPFRSLIGFRDVFYTSLRHLVTFWCFYGRIPTTLVLYECFWTLFYTNVKAHTTHVLADVIPK